MSDVAKSTPSIIMPDIFVYPERSDHDPGSLENIVVALSVPLVSSLSRLWLRRVQGLIQSLSADRFMPSISDDPQGAGSTAERHRFARRNFGRGDFNADAIEHLLPFVCTAVKETLSYQPEVSVLTSVSAMLRGNVTEIFDPQLRQMAIIMTAACAALAGRPVHVLASEDEQATQMATVARPVYENLGLSVSVIDAHSTVEERRMAYECDIVHASAQHVAFDHLRDRMVSGTRRSNLELKLSRFFSEHHRRSDASEPNEEDGPEKGFLLRGLVFAVIDHADTVLLDNALMPLLITHEVGRDEALQMAHQAFDIADKLSPETDYSMVADEYRIDLSEEGRKHIHALSDPFGGSWRVTVQREEMVSQALIVRTLLEKGVHYEVNDGELHITDAVLKHLIGQPHIGDGLRQMIEFKEDCELSGRKVPAMRSAFARVFMRYWHLCGAAPVTRGAARELWKAYRLPVIPVAPAKYNKVPFRALPDMVGQMATIIEKTRMCNEAGKTVIINARGTEMAEHISEALSQAQIAHENINHINKDAAPVNDFGNTQVVIITDFPRWLTLIERYAADETPIGQNVHIIMSELYPSRRAERHIDAMVLTMQGEAKNGEGEPGLEYVLSLEDKLLAPLHTGVLGYLLNVLRMLRDGWASQAVFMIAQIMAERKATGQRASLLSTDVRLKRLLAISGQME